MKKIIALVVLVVLALAVVPLAAAGGKPGGGGWAHGKSKFNAVGTLTAVDAENGAITVKIKAATKSVKKYRGAEWLMTVDPKARVRLVTADGCVDAVLADLPVDVKVKVRGRVDRSDPAAPDFTVTFVKVKASVPVVAPSPAP